MRCQVDELNCHIVALVVLVFHIVDCDLELNKKHIFFALIVGFSIGTEKSTQLYRATRGFKFATYPFISVYINRRHKYLPLFIKVFTFISTNRLKLIQTPANKKLFTPPTITLKKHELIAKHRGTILVLMELNARFVRSRTKKLSPRGYIKSHKNKNRKN